MALCAAIPSPRGAAEEPRQARKDGDRAIVPHPRELRFPALEFHPPIAARHRHRLANGNAVYVVEDRSLPLVEVDVLLRVGSYLDPEGLDGLAHASGSQMRAGGTRSLAPDAFDEEADFLAAEISTSFGDTSGEASLDCLSKDLDRGLDLLFGVLATPRFDEGRLAVYKQQVLQSLARRNDSTASIEAREWNRLVYGASHYAARQPTRATVEAITREQLAAFHGRWVHPENVVFAVSGDVSAADIIPRLEARLQDWKRGERAPPVPAPAAAVEPGVYLVRKDDVNQGRVSVGHRAVQRDHPDYAALLIMNHILGGGGFTSRILGRVRSDEGLAYTALSEYEFGTYHEGEFRAYFQSRSPSVARALAIVIEEIHRIRDELVSPEEIDIALNYFLGAFPRRFSTPAQVARRLAQDELEGRPAEFWMTLEARLRAVTREDVQRVARAHLRPDALVTLVVGNEADLLEGDPAAPAYSIEKAAGGRGVRRIPLPDPETLAYPR
jgi:predicted Zn-dependent peptidase